MLYMSTIYYYNWYFCTNYNNKLLTYTTYVVIYYKLNYLRKLNDGIISVYVNHQSMRGRSERTLFVWPCVLSDRPSMFWWLSHGEGKDAVT